MRNGKHQLFPVVQQTFRVSVGGFQFPPVSLALADVIDDKNNKKHHQQAGYDCHPRERLGKLFGGCLLLFQTDTGMLDFLFFEGF